MPLTHNYQPGNPGLPLLSQPPTRALPIDVNMLFAQNQTFTASGDLNNGAASIQVDLGPGRMDGLWVIDLQTLKVSAGDETYRLALLGSNDPGWAAGNVEVLAIHDWAAATSGRLVPVYCGPSPTVPPPGPYPGGGGSARRHVFPFSNEVGGYVLRWSRAYLIVGGTSPGIKLTSWVTVGSW